MTSRELLKSFLDQSGIGMIGVLFAAGAIGLIAVQIMQMTQSGLKQSSKNENQADLIQLREELFLALSPRFCGMATISEKLKVNTTTKSPIPLQKLRIEYDGNEITLNGNSKLGKYKLYSPEPFSFSPPSKNTAWYSKLLNRGLYENTFVQESDLDYFGELTVNLVRPESAAGSNRLQMRYLVRFQLDTNGDLDTCRPYLDLSRTEKYCDEFESNVIHHEWQDASKTCNVVVNRISEPSGTCAANDVCNAGPNYVLISIP